MMQIACKAAGKPENAAHRWTDRGEAFTPRFICSDCGTLFAEMPKAPEKPVAGLTAPARATSDSLEDRIKSLPVMSDEEEACWFREQELIPHIEAAGVPERFWDDCPWTEPKQRAVYGAVLSRLTGKGAIIALVGKRGTGKTTIAAEVVKELFRRFYKWKFARAEDRDGKTPIGHGIYRKTIDVVGRLQPLYDNQGTIDMEALLEMRDELASFGLLILDEIHDAIELRSTDRTLTDLLDRRYASRKDSLLISNQTEQEFRQTINPSILSRLAEHGLIIPCEWGSFRKSAATAAP